MQASLDRPPIRSFQWSQLLLISPTLAAPQRLLPYTRDIQLPYTAFHTSFNRSERSLQLSICALSRNRGRVSQSVSESLKMAEAREGAFGTWTHGRWVCLWCSVSKGTELSRGVAPSLALFCSLRQTWVWSSPSHSSHASDSHCPCRPLLQQLPLPGLLHTRCLCTLMGRYGVQIPASCHENSTFDVLGTIWELEDKRTQAGHVWGASP